MADSCFTRAEEDLGISMAVALWEALWEAFWEALGVALGRCMECTVPTY